MVSFGFLDRDAIIDTMGRDVFDVVIIGGGITGAGIARDAALRGLRTALIERSDFSIGTSSRSSKLVHGGLRYLRNGEFGLVHESTTERNLLTSRLAPNLVRPLPFLVPVWEGSKMGLGTMGAALFMYDALGEFGNYRINRPLSKKALLQMAPLLRQPGLRGGFVYYDSITDDTRLTIETIKDAVLHGAAAVSRVGATSLEFHDGRVEGVVAHDSITGRDLFIRARSVVVATGIWSSETARTLGVSQRATLSIRPTRGSHIVLPYEKFPIDHAVTMAAPRDGRAMFVIPWNGMTVLGTTDTDHDGDMMDVFASKWDVDYLLESGCHNFQGLKATASDVVGTWSGLRPLIASEGSESSVSREHSIVVDDRGIVTIAGGKLTTYRIMAEQALKAAAPFFNKRLVRPTACRSPLACSTGLGDRGAISQLADRIVNSADLDRLVAAGLVTNYGVDASSVADIAAADRSLAVPLVQGHPFIGAEIVYAVRHEMALTLEDALLRRTPVFFLSRDEDGSTIDRAAAVMARECGWDQDRTRDEVDRLRARKDKHLQCIR